MGEVPLESIGSYYQPSRSDQMVHFQTSDSPWQTSPEGLAVKVNPRSEIGRFGLIGLH